MALNSVQQFLCWGCLNKWGIQNIFLEKYLRVNHHRDISWFHFKG